MYLKESAGFLLVFVVFRVVRLCWLFLNWLLFFNLDELFKSSSPPALLFKSVFKQRSFFLLNFEFDNNKVSLFIFLLVFPLLLILVLDILHLFFF